MPFDPTNTEDLARLRRCIREARQQFEPLYDNRKVLLDALSDPCHRSAEVDTLDRKPHNPLDRMIRITTRGVVDQNPTLRIVRTKNPRGSGMLKSQLEDWADQVILADKLQAIFQEGLLRWGWMYTGFEVGDTGYGMIPFADVLDFDDCFIDQRGNDENDIDFEGHCYARRFDAIANNPTYNQNVVDKLADSAKKRYRNKVYTLYDWLDLKCVYLPQERVEVTLAGEDNMTMEPLRIKPYTGPPPGPYLKLRLGEVRGTMIPVSRASLLYDLSEFIVRAYRQVYTQADRSLEGWAFPGSSERDAEKHRTLRDGEYISMENPAGVVSIKKGGVDNRTLASAIHADDLFDADAGNLKLLGGLGPSAPTARQEAGLGAGATGGIDEMRGRMAKFTKRVYEVAGWYIQRDPLREGMVEWTTPNGNTVESEWTPQVGAMMNPNDPEMEIVPGSMVSRSAEAQLQFLERAVQSIAAMMALPGEEPEVFRHRRHKELWAEYGNAPELLELFGEAPTPEAVIPGVEGAAEFGRRQGRPPTSNGQAGGGNKMVERMIFSSPQNANA